MGTRSGSQRRSQLVICHRCPRFSHSLQSCGSVQMQMPALLTQCHVGHRVTLREWGSEPPVQQGRGGRRGNQPNRLQRADGCRWITGGVSRGRVCVGVHAVCLEVVCVSVRERPVRITPRLTDDNLHAHSLVRHFSSWFFAAAFSRLSGSV